MTVGFVVSLISSDDILPLLGLLLWVYIDMMRVVTLLLFACGSFHFSHLTRLGQRGFPFAVIPCFVAVFITDLRSRGQVFQEARAQCGRRVGGLLLV